MSIGTGLSLIHIYGKIFINYEILHESLVISIKNEGSPIDYSVIKRLNEENLSDVQRHGMGLSLIHIYVK